MKEIWKDVEGFEQEYQISNFGRLKCKVKKTWNGKCVCTRKEKIKRLSKPNKFGYVMTTISKNGIKHGVLIHRLVAIAFIPNPTERETVNHKDGDKTNNRDSNLEWATRSEQNIHASKLGLKRFNGEDHSQHKLTESEVLEIRHLAKCGGIPKSSSYGVSKQTIRDVISRRSWTHI